jgi:hypothetical protein
MLTRPGTCRSASGIPAKACQKCAKTPRSTGAGPRAQFRRDWLMDDFLRYPQARHSKALSHLVELKHPVSALAGQRTRWETVAPRAAPAASPSAPQPPTFEPLGMSGTCLNTMESQVDRNEASHLLLHGNRSGDPSTAPRCGAKTRSGRACQAPAMRSTKTGNYTRCRMHGGASTGPRTEEGLERCRRARWKDGLRSSAAMAERRTRRMKHREIMAEIDRLGGLLRGWRTGTPN